MKRSLASIDFPHIFLLLAFTVMTGCSHTIGMSRAVQPRAFVAQKFSASAAVVFPEEMTTYVDHVRPVGLSGAHSYDFDIGKELCTAVFRSVQIAYEDPVLLRSALKRGEYHRIIKFSLQETVFDMPHIELLDGSTDLHCTISVSIEAYDGQTMTLMRKTTITGTGFTSKFPGVKRLSLAVEAAVQQVCDETANLLISGFAEPIMLPQSNSPKHEQPVVF